MRIPCWDDDLKLCDHVINVHPIFNHRQFQRLGHVKQLGQTSRVFPGAMHGRLEHSLGVFVRTKKQALDWYQRGLIKMTDVTTLCVFALIHDIGHFPFSHALEPILGINHHENGIAIIREMHDAIGACGTSVEAVIKCFEGGFPLAEAVSHSLLGTDKIDYLIRDAHHTGFGGAPETKIIQSRTWPFEGRIVLEKSAQYEAMQLQQFMYTMYSRVYERSKNAYAQRLLQKLYERIKAAGVLAEETLSRMTDAQFEGACEQGDDADLAYFYDMYRGLHSLPWTGLLVCPKGFGLYFTRSDKDKRRVVEMELEAFDALSSKITWSNAGRHEQACAPIIGTKERHIFVQPSRRSKRYAMPKTTIFDGGKTCDLTEIVTPDRNALERMHFIRIGTNDMDAVWRIHSRADDLIKTLLA